MRKGNGKMRSNFTSMLRSKGKGLCAAALCTTLVLNNIGSSVVSAAAVQKNNNGSMATASDAAESATPSDATVSKENGVYEYELSRQVLYDALQEAIANDWQAAPLEAEGDYADEYESFFEEYGNVYQLKPDIQGNDRKVGLEIYALVDDEIGIDTEYMVSGEEQFLFLLTNKSKDEQKAEIYIEEKHTGVVKLVTEATVRSDDFEGSEIVIETETSGEKAEAPSEPAETGSADSPEEEMPDVSVVDDDEIVIPSGSDENESEAADEEETVVKIETEETEAGETEAEETEAEEAEVEEADDEEITIAAISRHDAAWVMATPANAEEAEDEENDEAETATPSDAEDKDLLDVELYDAVITEDGAATGLVILAEEMGLDDPTLISLESLKPYDPITVEGAEYITVEIKAKEGAIQAGAEPRATLIAADDAKYNEAKEALDNAENPHSYTGMMALDIGFWIGEEEVEPYDDEAVQVSIHFNPQEMSAEMEEEIVPEAVAIHHIVEGDNGLEAQPVAGNVEISDTVEGKVEALSADEAVAEFWTESFSTFTITWGDGLAARTVNITLVGTDGETISTTDYKYSVGTEVTLADIAPELSLYEYQRAEYNGKEITHLRAQQGRYGIVSLQYKQTNEKQWNEFGWDVIPTVNLIYKKIGEVPPVEEGVQKLSHDKYANLRTDGSGTYDLTLTISGEIGSVTNKAELDIVYVVDVSGSMKDKIGDGYSRGSKLDQAKAAIKTMVDSLSQNEKLDVRFSLVSFSGSDDNGRWNDSEINEDWTSNASEITQWLDGKSGWNNPELSASGGTNYQAGLRNAKSLLDEGRSGSVKAVVFVSDGNPGYYYNDNGKTEGTGDPGNSYNKTALDKAKTAVKNLNCNYFYTVGVGSDDEKYDCLDTLQKAATQVPESNRDFLKGTDETALKDAFDSIEGSISYMGCTDVNVYDTLSEYVDIVKTPAGEPESLKIEIKNEDNKVVAESATGQDYLVYKGNKITASYDPLTKQIHLKFPEQYQLEKGLTYLVTAHIEPTEAAYKAYQENNLVYPHEPEEGTGTHAERGENGFFSNVENKAYVSYKYKGEDGGASYLMPVVQLTPGTLIIEKKISGDDLTEKEKQDLVDQIAFTVTRNGVEETLKLNQFEEDAANKGTYRYPMGGLSPNTSYSVVESDNGLSALSGYEVTTTDSKNTTGVVTKGETKTVIFNNDYSKQLTLTVKKVVGGNMGDKTGDYSFKATIYREGQDITSQILTESLTGEFTLKDVNNYPEDGEKKISGLKKGDIITIEETGLGQEYEVTVAVDSGTADSDGSDKKYTTGNSGIQQDTVVTFTNTKEIQTPTGLFTDNLPYLMMLAIATIGTAGSLYPVARRKRRGSGEE